MKPELKHRLINIGSAAIAGLGSLISPVDSPTKVSAESNLQQNTLTLLHGDGSRARLNIMLLPYNGATTQMLQEVAEDIFLIPPTDEFKNKVNVYTKNPTENLNCNQNADCDWDGAVKREINRIVATGIIPHETMMVIKSNEDFRGAGLALLASRLTPPDLYTSSAIVRPLSIPSEFRQFFAAGAIAHELWGHAFAGIPDNEPGVPDLMTHYSGVNSFNPHHTQFLRSMKPIIPGNYLTPKNEVRLAAGSLSIRADLITPTGTTQQYRRITPFNNDGPGVELIRDPENSFIVPAPPDWYGLLPDTTYIWEECTSGIPVFLDSAGKPVYLDKNDPRWRKVEGWPGVWFPNPCAEQKFKTPKRFADGITAVSPKTGEVVNTSNPTLVWANKDKDVFYYEVQASKDCSFNTDPQTAIASVIWELRHGGVTNPLNSYTVPASARLDLGTEYCWRVRPRIQGDGTPVDWSQTFRFSTPATLKGRTVSMAEHNGRIEELKRAQAESNRSKDEHWQWVGEEVLTTFEAYRREEELLVKFLI